MWAIFLKKRGMTLMETMATVVVLSIIAGFGVTSFTTTKRSQELRVMDTDMKATHGEAQVHFARNKSYDYTKVANRAKTDSKTTVTVDQANNTVTTVRDQLECVTLLDAPLSATNPVCKDLKKVASVVTPPSTVVPPSTVTPPTSKCKKSWWGLVKKCPKKTCVMGVCF